MFSVNHKISGRQLYRNYAVGLTALGALLPPLVMNRENIGCILFSLILLGLYLGVSIFVPRPRSVFVKALCYLHYWVLGTMAARMTGLLAKEFLLTDSGLWLILGWFYLFCFYNLYKGLECRARVSEILFSFFIIMLLFLSLLMLGETEPDRVWEIRLSLTADKLGIGYRLFCWLGAAQSLWHLHGQVRTKRDWQRSVAAVWITGAAAVILWSLFSYCIYGDKGDTGLIFPLASAMTLAHLPGNVIGRLDALFVFTWLIGLFLLCSSLFAPLIDGEPDTRRKYALFAVLAASYAASLNPRCMEWGQEFLYYISTPAQILILLWHCLGKRAKKAAAACICLAAVLLTGGCGRQELEQLSLVTAVGVDSGEDGGYRMTFGFGSAKEEGEKPFETQGASLQEAVQTYWLSTQKQMDFNHLKNIYFSTELLSAQDFPELLEEIQTNEAYSRGIMVHAAQGDAGECAGRREQPEEGVPIHRLLNAWYNKTDCEIPLVTAEGLYKGSVLWPYSE